MKNRVIYLKHKNITTAALMVDECSNILAVKIREQTRKHLPVSVSDEASLKTWLMGRGIPAARKDFERDFGGVSSFELMLNNLGLSLVDCYWLCPGDYEKSWQEVNLYSNHFRESYSLDLDRKETIADIYSKTNFVPSTSLKGDLKKKWIIRKNNIRSLVKGNYGSGCVQSLSEVLASEIHKRQGAAHAPYHLIHISSNGRKLIGCICDAFTSEQVEFISAYEALDHVKKPNSISYYEFFIECCARLGVDVRDFLEYQILTDFVISNNDRHLNNFGLLRDADSLEMIGIAPIFDSGNSMFYSGGYIPTGKGLLDLDTTSFFSKEVKLLKQVKDRSQVNLSLLPGEDYVYRLLKIDAELSEERVSRTVEAYRQKIVYLDDFMNGADLWDYKYRR